MVELCEPNINRVLLAVSRACPGMPKPGPEVFKGLFLPPKEQINALFLAQCYRVPRCLPISEFASDKSKGPQDREYGSPGECKQSRRGVVVEKGVDKRGLEV